MRRYEIIESKHNENKIKNPNNIILHKNILDILFKHKEDVYKRLIDLKGTFHIDHVAIKIINPNNEIAVFSITPSVEYNLIVQGLWKYDYGFYPNLQKLNKIHIWEDAYSKEYFNEIKFLKEIKHGFTFGFNIPRKHGAFYLMYSFATRSKNNNLADYYHSYSHELCELGDYGYKLIHNIYSRYCHSHFETPSIVHKEIRFVKSFLKLIVNNK